VTEVELHRDWVDYALVVFTALTGGAAVYAAWIAGRGTKRANENTEQVLESLRGNLEPTDQLLTLMAHRGTAERLRDFWSWEEITPTRWERNVELCQRELSLMPADVLPRLRDLVDSAQGYFGREVTNPRRYEDTDPGLLVEELTRYMQTLDDQIDRLRATNPAAVGGLFVSR